MHIKSNVFYKKSTDSYDEFTRYGKDIVLADDGTVATEALVLMLVSFQGQWKYAVGYTFIDKIDGNDLHCFLSRALGLCIASNIKVKT